MSKFEQDSKAYDDSNSNSHSEEEQKVPSQEQEEHKETPNASTSESGSHHSELPQFPSKPQRSKKFNSDSSIKDITVYSNHYPIHMNNMKDKIFIYSFVIDPEVPVDSRKMIGAIVRGVRPELEKVIGQFIQSGMNIFSQKKSKDTKKLLAFQTPFNEKLYTVRVDFKKGYKLSDLFSEESGVKKEQVKLFLNILVKNLLKENDYVELGRLKKYFNYKDEKNAVNIRDMGIDIWTGIQSTIKLCYNTDGDVSPFLCIDFCARVIRR